MVLGELLVASALLLVNCIVVASGRTSWPRVEELHEGSGYTLAWDPTPDSVGLVHFALSVRTRGYIGFGLSDTGTMAGADLLVAWPENATHLILMDMYAAQNGLPGEDAHADWVLEGGAWRPQTDSTEGSGTLELRVARRVDTGDHEDLPIAFHSMYVLYSWGNSREVEYHGSSQRGARRLQLLGGEGSLAALARGSGLSHTFLLCSLLPSLRHLLPL